MENSCVKNWYLFDLSFLRITTKNENLFTQNEDKIKEYETNVKLFEGFDQSNKDKIQSKIPFKIIYSNTSLGTCFRIMRIILKQKLYHYLQNWQVEAKRKTNKMNNALECINRVWGRSLKYVSILP